MKKGQLFTIFFSIITICFLLPIGLFAQVKADSPMYQKLKESGQLGKYNVEPSVSNLPPAKVKPHPSEKASACDCYIAPDATYTLAMQPNDDGSSANIPIPFNFNLYGNIYTSIYINNNERGLSKCICSFKCSLNKTNTKNGSKTPCLS